MERKRRMHRAAAMLLTVCMVLELMTGMTVYGQEAAAERQEASEEAGETATTAADPAGEPREDPGQEGQEAAAGQPGEPEQEAEAVQPGEPAQEAEAEQPEESEQGAEAVQPGEPAQDPAAAQPGESAQDPEAEQPEDAERKHVEEAEKEEKAEKEAAADGLSVSYAAHVQNLGWLDPVKDGAVGGTQKQSLRMEALRISLVSGSGDPEERADGSVVYRAHVQDYGWMGEVQDGALAGTEGEKKRLEAVEIRLTGAAAEKYDIYYRAHVSNYGTLGWAKNGETAGTMQLAIPIESVEIILVEKGSGNAPVQNKLSCYTKECKGTVTYSAHVKNLGWMDPAADGAMAGTQGKSLQMEALKINLSNPKDETGAVIGGSIEYRAHVQDYGWRNWAGNGQEAGTTGESKRLEAVEIRLTGELAEKYDVYYRTHVSGYGTLGWAKNGETAGTTQLAHAVESVEIMLVEKGSGNAPVQDKLSCYTPTKKGMVTYSAHVKDLGWMDSVADGAMAGTEGRSLRMEALRINLNPPVRQDGKQVEGSIRYRTHVQDYGWMDWIGNGGTAGTTGKAKRIEAVQIELTGDMAQYYDIYYRVHAQSFGWLGWAKNGASAGTSGLAKQVEAVEIRLTAKGGATPGSTARPYLDETALVAGMRISSGTNQILVVNAKGGTRAEVKLWEKQNGSWKITRTMSGFVGSKGVGAAREGISRTPQGAYTLGFAFGIGSNPGTKLSYRRITQNSYWVGDSSSPYYNTWQEYPYRKSWKDEHLIDYRISYEFAITLDYDNGPGGGSAFFLHVSNGIPTAGCISVPRDQMLYLMRTIGEGAYIVNVNDIAELTNY